MVASSLIRVLALGSLTLSPQGNDLKAWRKESADTAAYATKLVRGGNLKEARAVLGAHLNKYPYPTLNFAITQAYADVSFRLGDPAEALRGIDLLPLSEVKSWGPLMTRRMFAKALLQKPDPGTIETCRKEVARFESDAAYWSAWPKGDGPQDAALACVFALERGFITEDEGAHYAAEGLKLDPGNPVLTFTLAQFYLRHNQFKEMLPIIDAALPRAQGKYIEFLNDYHWQAEYWSTHSLPKTPVKNPG